MRVGRAMVPSRMGTGLCSSQAVGTKELVHNRIFVIERASRSGGPPWSTGQQPGPQSVDPYPTHSSQSLKRSRSRSRDHSIRLRSSHDLNHARPSLSLFPLPFCYPFPFSFPSLRFPSLPLPLPSFPFAASFSGTHALPKSPQVNRSTSEARKECVHDSHVKAWCFL